MLNGGLPAPNVRKVPEGWRVAEFTTVETVTTLRKLADMGSEVIQSQGSYNLVAANCQTFSKEFLARSGYHHGYDTYVDNGIGIVAGLLTAGTAMYVYNNYSWLAKIDECAGFIRKVAIATGGFHIKNLQHGLCVWRFPVWHHFIIEIMIMPFSISISHRMQLSTAFFL